MKTLVIAEHDNTIIKLATRQAINAASQLSDETHLLIIGFNCDAALEDAKKINAVNKILIANHENYTHQLAENCAQLIAQQAKNYNYILAGATTFGKNLLPRVAALLDLSMVSDVIKIIDHNTFIRPIYAGNALATVQSKDPIKVLSIRGTAFKAVEMTNNVTDVFQLNDVISNDLSQFVKQTLTQSKRPDLTAAKIIISGGRGLKSAENFKLLDEIADQLGAAVGASRAAVDAGFAPNDYQVGQTGKVVAPDLYIAVGISGAIQHLAGMKESKVIVAINSDPDAPIFQIADYALVGDLFKILPELKTELRKVLK